MMTYKFFFTFLSCVAIASAGAQTSPLEGRWKLESASAIKITGTDTVDVDIDTVRDEVSDLLSETLVFNADTLTFPERDDCGCGHRGPYKLTGDYIEIPFTAAPIGIDFRIADGRLHFRQQFLFGMEPPYTYRIFTVYSKQS
jgi:hypothetical protein